MDDDVMVNINACIKYVMNDDLMVNITMKLLGRDCNEIFYNVHFVLISI